MILRISWDYLYIFDGVIGRLAPLNIGYLDLMMGIVLSSSNLSSSSRVLESFIEQVCPYSSISFPSLSATSLLP